MHLCIRKVIRGIMKRYSCIMCEDCNDTCTAFVLDKTPEDFDKSIMDKFCRRVDKQPVWFRERA